MRRLTPLLAFLLAAAVAGPALAQDEPNPIDEFIRAVRAPENQEYVSQFLRQPTEGTGQVMDPVGDFEHSTGHPPGYTPEFIDIIDAWTYDFGPGGPPVFGPTDGSDPLWAPGNLTIDMPDGPPLTTFTIDGTVHDGSQFDDGAFLFGVTTAEMPPAVHPGRCEFAVWVNDLSSSLSWVNDPAFPQDPAGGTNMAFAIGINPEGLGESSTFTLDLAKSGFFEARAEYDVRGFILDDYVGIFVPKEAAPDIAGVNFYTFCVEEGISFDPSVTGSDQTGLIQMTPDDFGIVEIALQSTTTTTTTTTTAPTSTTAQETTTTTAATTTTVAAAATTVAAAEAGDDGGGFPWGLVLGGGIVLVVLGWWLYNREGGDPCAELLKAWQAAQAECDRARQGASEAKARCDELNSDVADLESERKELCREWPPACLPEGDDGAWIEDDQGNRITSRDLHLRRQALGQVWSDYKAGKLSAQEVEARWQEADTPQFREDMRQKDAAAKEELQDLDGDLTDARQMAKDACEQAEAAEARATAACEKAEAAKRAYEECVGAAVAAAAGGAGGEEPGTGTGGEPGTVTGGADGSQPDPCEGKPPRKVEPAGPPDPIRVTVDFSLFIEVEEGSGRNVAAGQEISFGLQQVARELDVVGDLLSAREAGLDIGGGLNGYAAGTYVRSTAGIVKGGVGAVLAGADTKFDVPTSIPTAIVETLETLAKMGSRITRAVTNWMEHYQMKTARVRYFTQTITATPYTVWECRPGVGYVCVEKVWEISVGKLTRGGQIHARQYLSTSELDRWRQQREWSRVTRIAMNRVLEDAKKLVEWRRRHQPGPCQ